MQIAPAAPAAGATFPAKLVDAPIGFRARTEDQHRQRLHRLQITQTFHRLRESGLSVSKAAKQLQLSSSTLWRWHNEWQIKGDDALFDDRDRSGRKPSCPLTDSDVQVLRECYLITNRTADSGSGPEAVRKAIRDKRLTPLVAAFFSHREATGQSLLPDSVRRRLQLPAAIIAQYRSPKNASLDYLHAAGTQMWIGEDFARAGDILEMDDATINFPVCVPWEIGGDPCSEKFGVRVGRFQWLAAIDVATRFIPGWSYTARPRASYRAEDITATLLQLFRAHGVWKRVRFEQGSWKSNLVVDTLKQLGVELMTVHSPHQKPFIEGLFNHLWTKLSDLPGQVGRYRGEMEEENRVLTSCTRGATDPRELFPMLSAALSAFDRSVDEYAGQRIRSAQYGEWVPSERWTSQLAQSRADGRLRPLPADSAWMFSPVIRIWKVDGGTVGGSVQIMEGFSIRFDFAAEWLVWFSGHSVKVFFDPAAPKCSATIVLAEDVRERRSGEVLGTAIQVNKTARYARKVMGWGDDPDLGLDVRKAQAASMRREVRTYGTDSKPNISTTEVRDGLGRATTIERGATTTNVAPAPEKPEPVAPRRWNRLSRFDE